MFEQVNHILVVDDDLKNIQVGVNILKDQGDYHIIFATSGEQALQRVEETSFDLILLDILMQPMDGYEVCRRLKSDPATRNIPIIFLTAKTDTESLIKAFEVGGVDYITKPFNSCELSARVKTHLELKCFHDKEIEETQKDIILTMSHICEFKSLETGKHIHRVAEISALLAQLCGLDKATCAEIRWSTAMHDVGKVAIPASILHKPARLTPEEFEIIKTHTTIGHDILKKSNKPLLKSAAIIAHQHHEHWDGSGYPQGLGGEEIDIRGRIVIIADVFDALLQKRSYKKSWAIEDVKEYMFSLRDIKFEPALLDLFLGNIADFIEIEERLKDQNSPDSF